MLPLFSDDFMIAARKEVREEQVPLHGAGTPMYYDVWLKR